jgi:hypothetical protein
MIKFINCGCNSNDHLIRLEVDNLCDCPALSVSVLLNKLGFWRRLINAVKYVFNIGQPPYFDDFIVSSESCKDIMDVCACYLELTAGSKYWDEQFQNLDIKVDSVANVQDLVLKFRKVPAMLKYIDIAIDMIRKSIDTKIHMKMQDDDVVIQCDITVPEIMDVIDNVSDAVFATMTADGEDVHNNYLVIHAQ